jgi:hypothetical protein
MYLAEREHVVGSRHVIGCKCRPCGRFRGELARDWVRVAEQQGLHQPGQDAREPLREGESEEYRRVDAARTRIRQFEAGQAQSEWVLVGLETAIADRHGMAYPAAAYVTQGTLPVG